MDRCRASWIDVGSILEPRLNYSSLMNFWMARLITARPSSCGSCASAASTPVSSSLRCSSWYSFTATFSSSSGAISCRARHWRSTQPRPARVRTHWTATAALSTRLRDIIRVPNAATDPHRATVRPTTPASSRAALTVGPTHRFSAVA